ncbi:MULTISPECIES: FecR domain-containing protein [Burkholderia]|uniref:Iron dicitrate transport regulator FecR n=1 Tax=Burkholderia mayonis TaxID=1385591 RepID=A0A1B4FJ56_9BURK|nr:MULTISPECIES: FecR domain-containing protein [Burkholderia]AOJ03723.1 iron dicitrate transport regulator FecR [Burkholderia mayonis]KVE41562.1 iron dicitrate transport regulator FecR [Burkholderia sp. BDU5]KVE46891.1 iron dicitrate transport regulator FecR [Burkholderia mayonis]
MAASSSSAAADPGVHADFASLEQAANWYALLYADGGSGEHRKAWAEWLAERPEHRRAWAHIEAVSRRFEPLRGESLAERNAAAAAVHVSATRAASRRHVLGSLAALAGTGLAGWLAWRFTALPDRLIAWRPDYRTGVGERRDVQLADGTRVWLNTDSAFDVHYDDTKRLLTLTMGEILIDTAKDGQERPFFVDTPNGRMQALGTRFTVRQSGTHTLLAVFKGRVEIRNLAGHAEIVAAGQQRQFTADAISSPERADPAREAWSRGVILADDVTLDALIAELDRYQHGHIGVDPEVAGIRVVGRFPADDPDRMLSMLERDLPIRVRRTLPWWVTIEAR